MSSKKSKKKKKKKHKSKDDDSSIFAKKKNFTTEEVDEWDFEKRQELEMANQQKKNLTTGDKLENAIHNTGEMVEETVHVIVTSNSKNIKNVRKMRASKAVSIIDDIIPEKWVHRIMGCVMFAYGFIGIISIVLLIVYCIDHFISTFYKTYQKHDYIFLYTIIGLCSCGAILGMYGTFKYGAVDEQMQKLNKQNNGLKKSIENVSADQQKLNTSIGSFQMQVGIIMDNSNDLRQQIDDFGHLETALKQVAKSQNTEIMLFLGEVRALFKEFKLLQVQVEKTNLLSLFYELEFSDDGLAGLNKQEFQGFLNRLDGQTASKFRMKTFEQLDRNGDGNIDLNEFQAEIDRIYNKMDVKSANAKRKNNKTSAQKWNDWL